MYFIYRTVAYMKKSKRSKPISVRVSEEERRKFLGLAASRHTDISELIRQLLHQAADAKQAA